MKTNHRRKASSAHRILQKSRSTGAAKKVDCKALRRAAAWVNKRGEK